MDSKTFIQRYMITGFSDSELKQLKEYLSDEQIKSLSLAKEQVATKDFFVNLAVNYKNIYKIISYFFVVVTLVVMFYSFSIISSVALIGCSILCFLLSLKAEDTHIIKMSAAAECYSKILMERMVRCLDHENHLNGMMEEGYQLEIKRLKQEIERIKN